MLKVAALVVQEEVDNAPPKPRGRIESFRTVAPQFFIPVSSLVALHLPRMGLPHDRRQMACNMGGLSAVKRVYFDLEILRQQFWFRRRSNAGPRWRGETRASTALGMRCSSDVVGLSQDLPSTQNCFDFCRFELDVETLIEQLN
jgi:hypothetical protein